MNNNKKTVVLIDGNFFAWRAYATRSLKTSKGIPTSVISGMLQMIKSIKKKFIYDRIIICWDSTKGSALRKNLFPEYKANRREHKEDKKSLFDQMKDARKFFKTLNVRQAIAKGVEGDDIMGILSNHYISEGNVIIVSADRDLLQLIEPGVRVYRPITDQIVGPKEFKKMYGISPRDYIRAKSLMGDKGDNIPGVPGIGEKRSIEIVKKYKRLKDIINDINAKPYVRQIKKYIKTVSLAYKLVKICKVPNDLGEGYDEAFNKMVKGFGQKRSVNVSVMVSLIRSLEMKHRNWEFLADMLTITLE